MNDIKMMIVANAFQSHNEHILESGFKIKHLPSKTLQFVYLR